MSYISDPIYNGTYTSSETLEFHCIDISSRWAIQWRMEIFVFKDQLLRDLN